MGNAAKMCIRDSAYMDRFIDTIEWVAAGFVGIVAANIFISVLLRNIFNYSIDVYKRQLPGGRRGCGRAHSPRSGAPG